ncbi:MAG: WG repeat-containing protein [Thermodesulfovibrionales bacterium]
MTKIFAIIILLVGLQGVAAVPFEKDGKWGYKDIDGQVVIEPRFIIAGEFSPEGVAAVVDKKGWAYVNKSGEVVIRPHVYDNGPDYFSEGLARFSENGKFGFFDKTGNVVIKPAFDFAFPFREGLARVCNGCKLVKNGVHTTVEGGKWGYIDTRGKLVIQLGYEDARDFSDGVAKVKKEGKWIIINYK